MQRMKSDVPPLVGVALILAVLAAVLILYWQGLLREETRGSGGGAGMAGGPAGRGEEPPAGLPEVEVETVAGQTQAGYRDAPAAQALFDGPAALAVVGETVYIVDSRNHAIRALRNGQVVTIAGGSSEPGYADGRGRAAAFFAPAGIAAGPDGAIFVADTGNHRIRRVSPDGAVSTYAGAATQKDDLGRELGGYRDGPVAAAQFRYPVGLAVGGDGTLYVADAGNHAVRRISPQRMVSTIAADGKLESPTAVCLTPDGAIWVSDTAGASLWTGPAAGPLRRWKPKEPQGDGFAPSGLAWVSDTAARDNWRLCVADSAANHLLGLEEKGLLLVAGQSGPEAAGWADGGGESARFSSPAGLAADRAGRLYLADYGNNCLRRVDVSQISAGLSDRARAGGGGRSRSGGRRGGGRRGG
ncbi:MAG: hypothetical protein ACE149_14520 [Armatimonadota bacterium]